jgi:membrane-bound ClpP family serine protease
MTWLTLLLAVETAPVTEGLSVTGNLFAAIGLLILSLGLIAVEFAVVSGGALGLAAVGCGLAAVWFAFAAGSLAGWVFTLLVPICCLLVINAGLRWMRTSSLVVQSVVTEHAGYAHAAANQGVAVGSTGALVTDAFPTGRARFGTAELDVLVRGAVLGKGTAIIVRSIEGPTIVVGPAPASSPTAS